MKKIVTLFCILTMSFGFLLMQSSCKSPTSKNNSGNQTGSFKTYIASLGKPVMVEFGSTSCTPCKMMESVLKDLQENYSNDLVTIFVHVAKERDKTAEFGIQMIPTQIFFNTKGEEIERHVGFISKEDILKTFTAFNINISS